MSALTLILGDQLTPDLSSLSDFNPSTDTVLMAEVMEEATYVGHHKKKLAFVFSAMRHFAEELEATGVAVRYVGQHLRCRGGTSRRHAVHRDTE